MARARDRRASTRVVPLPANGSRTVAPRGRSAAESTPATNSAEYPCTYGHQRWTGRASFDRNVIGPA